MSFAVLAPLGLAALAAWLLPLLIHLVRRVELETTPFAALRWIGARIQPQRRLRFERPWLLLLRLLLLGLLALLLARLALESPASTPATRVYVVPGADRVATAGTFDVAGADWRWLAPGFPRHDETLVESPVPLASLLREADASLPDGATLRVVAPRHLAGLDGERARLRHPIDWKVVDGVMPEEKSPSGAPIRVAVRYATDDVDGRRYGEAIVAAWNAHEPGHYVLDAAPADTPVPADTNWLLRFAPSPSPDLAAWIERGGRAVLAHGGNEGDPLWRDARGDVVARSHRAGNGRVIALPDAFAPAALPPLLDPGFPARLRIALADATPPPDRADAQAMRPTRYAEGVAHAPTTETATRALDAWFILAIAALFLLERIVATQHRDRDDA